MATISHLPGHGFSSEHDTGISGVVFYSCMPGSDLLEQLSSAQTLGGKGLDEKAVDMVKHSI